MNILEACTDPQLFAPWFRKRATWKAWFAFLAALFALPMTDEQLAIYCKHTGRNTPPLEAAEEAWLVVGRRGGKSFIMALIGVYLACFKEYRQFLQPGERATIAIIAADRKQARVILRYVGGLISGIAMLSRLIERETAEGFDLTNGVTIEVSSASFRATRGYTFAAVLGDEIAFWRTDDASANPDAEILAAVRPGLATIPGAMLICASSPYAKKGELWEVFHKYFGKSDGPLIWRATTRDMNPSVRQSIIDAAMERDPAKAASEYLAEFRSDLQDFVSLEVAEAAIIPARYELPPSLGITYSAFVDPSGGSVDSMTLAIAHRDRKDLGILDAVREWKAPFSPESVVSEAASLLRSYGLRKAKGDKYAGEWPRERFREHGIEYETSERSKSDLYKEFLPLLNGKRVELLDHPRTLAQLCALERRVARGGRDSIDHPPGQHDDIINSVAGVLVNVAGAMNELAIWERLVKPGEAELLKRLYA